jgi:hypothetical protein
MAAIYTAFKVSALLITLIFPLWRQRRKENMDHTELSDWAVNEKGQLENIVEKEAKNHPIKIKH